MEITFSQTAIDRALRGTQYRKDFQPETQQVLAGWVAYVARDHGATADATSWNGWRYRFTLPGASSAAHETVIAALLDLDPDAAIRTSRAVYRSRADYRRQKGVLLQP